VNLSWVLENGGRHELPRPLCARENQIGTQGEQEHLQCAQGVVAL